MTIVDKVNIQAKDLFTLVWIFVMFNHYGNLHDS